MASQIGPYLDQHWRDPPYKRHSPKLPEHVHPITNRIIEIITPHRTDQSDREILYIAENITTLIIARCSTFIMKDLSRIITIEFPHKSPPFSERPPAKDSGISAASDSSLVSTSHPPMISSPRSSSSLSCEPPPTERVPSTRLTFMVLEKPDKDDPYGSNMEPLPIVHANLNERQDLKEKGVDLLHYLALKVSEAVVERTAARRD